MTRDPDEPSMVVFAEFSALADDDPRRPGLRRKLVESHMPLAIHLARRFSGRSEPVEDLIQVAAVGLIKAIDRFDPGRGLEFSTFAAPTITGEIKRHFRDHGWLIHVPRRAQELQTALSAARADLSQELGRSPTVRELSDRLGVAQDVIVEALDVARAYSAQSLDLLAPANDSAPEHPALGFEESGFAQVEQRSVLRESIARLPPHEREVLLLRFYGNKTQTEIAALIGVSQMQVSRYVSRALSRLRTNFGAPQPAPPKPRRRARAVTDYPRTPEGAAPGLDGA